MKAFLQRLFNTEFLPTSEVRKIKVWVVLFFLAVISAATIPFSISFGYSLGLKIGIIAGLFVFYAVAVAFARLNRLKTAIQMSVLYTVAITLFYTQGTSSFYSYLFFYITIMVVVFYQELYLYLFYGTLSTAFGIAYVLFHQAEFVAIGGHPSSLLLFTSILFLFYLVFLIQILHSEKIYTDLNLDWVRMNQIIEKHQELSLFFSDELRKAAKEDPAFEDRRFQQAASEIAVFLAEHFRDRGKDIVNVLDLYLYVHERGLAHILDNDDFSVPMKKIASRLEKYLIGGRTEMTSMILNFFTKFQPTEAYKSSRYEYRLDRLSPSREDQILALAMLYAYLGRAVTGVDKYDQWTRVLSKEELAAMFGDPEMTELLSLELIAFFQDNRELFETTLIPGSGKE
jgi:hypothetical protein